MRATFSLVTDEAVHGSFDKLTFKADKLPALRHGMEQWELKFLCDNELLHTHVVKCVPGKGAEEARAIISEAAPFWARRACAGNRKDDAIKAAKRDQEDAKFAFEVHALNHRCSETCEEWQQLIAIYRRSCRDLAKLQDS